MQTSYALGTVCTINAFDSGTRTLYDELFSCIENIENKFSTTLKESYISKINEAAGKKDVKVPADVLFVIKTAFKIAELTSAAFDPTVGPLVELWGINTENAHLPSKEKIDFALGLVNFRNIKITEYEDGSGSVMLLKEGMKLDLGGIVKGYVADCLVKILENRKVKRAIIDLGGNIYVFGKKQDGSLWKVGVKDPASPSGEPKAVLSLKSGTVVTSGVYERFFEEDGIRYHHILDTKTGYPSNSELLSTTVISENSMLSDALSTSIFVLGKERGMELIKKINRTSDEGTKSFLEKEWGRETGLISCIFIDLNGDIFASSDLEAVLQARNRIPIFE